MVRYTMSLKIFESKFKKLIVSGCSFTHNNHTESCAWANLLADWTGMEIVNLATPGAGNGHIADSLILYLERNQPDPEDTLIMAMWSEIDRSDFIVSRNKYQRKTKLHSESFYDEYTEHYMAGGIHWNPAAIPDTALVREYNALQDEKSLSLRAWLNFNRLTNYLTINNYEYRYTTLEDIFYQKRISFLKELARLDLVLDLTNWILITGKESLGGFTVYHNERLPIDGHPTLNGHERWVKERLIPALVTEGILSNDIPV